MPIIFRCPKCSKPARVGYKYIDVTVGAGENQKTRKKKVRICKKCKQIID